MNGDTTMPAGCTCPCNACAMDHNCAACAHDDGAVCNCEGCAHTAAPSGDMGGQMPAPAPTAPVEPPMAA